MATSGALVVAKGECTERGWKKRIALEVEAASRGSTTTRPLRRTTKPRYTQVPDLNAVDWTPGRCRIPRLRAGVNERGCPSVELKTNWTAPWRGREPILLTSRPRARRNF